MLHSNSASFNATFDHAQHMQGLESARPREGCATCHTPANRGVAETIPARLSAHQTCYQCHSPGKSASNFSSCGSCHDFGRYSRTPTTARSYRVGFSHADHNVRTRLTCASCHTVVGRGLPQAKQVSSILPAQHNSNPRARSCVTCHKGQRAFGDSGPGFSDCRRCHKGFTFRG
ncbi:MAG: cytochrome c3 family protein [Pyrinomonadaceae bacterium]